VGLAYNRKEAKDHGEGGQLVGAALAGQRVLLVDDVITAGTAIREVLPLLEAAGAQLVAVLTALDRQERGAEGTRSAVQMLEAELQVPVRAIVTLDDILTWLATENQQGEQAALAAYRARYGASA
jgi:orotate phosphoribosyltransferase